MKTNIVCAIIIMVLLFFVNSVNAQYTIVVEEVDIPSNVVQKIAEEKNCSSLEDLACISGSEYLETAKNIGQNLNTNKTTVNVDIKGLFAAETLDRNSKTTMVYNGKFNMIMWDMKTVIQMTHEEMKGMAQQAEGMMNEMQKNMPDISKLLDNANLTEEQRSAAMQSMPGLFKNKSGQESGPTVKTTNKERTIVGMPATLYLIKDGNITKGIWASDVDKRLAEKYREVGESFEVMIPMKKEKTSEWKLLPGMYPLETVEVHDGGYGGPVVELNLTREIRKGNPPENAYYVPGKEDGFQVGGKELMMGGFMNR